MNPIEENWLRIAYFLKVEVREKSGKSVADRDTQSIDATVSDLKAFYQYVSQHKDPKIQEMPLKKLLDTLLSMPLGRAKIVQGRYFNADNDHVDLNTYLSNLPDFLKTFNRLSSITKEQFLIELLIGNHLFPQTAPPLFEQLGEHIRFNVFVFHPLFLRQIHKIQSSPVQLSEEVLTEEGEILKASAAKFKPLMDNDMMTLLRNRGFVVNSSAKSIRILEDMDLLDSIYIDEDKISYTLKADSKTPKTPHIIKRTLNNNASFLHIMHVINTIYDIDKTTITIDDTKMTYQLVGDPRLLTITKNAHNHDEFMHIKHVVDRTKGGMPTVVLDEAQRVDHQITDEHLIELLNREDKRINKVVTTVPMVSTYIDEAIRASYHATPTYKDKTETRCLVLIPDFDANTGKIKADTEIIRKIDMEIAAEPSQIIEAGLVEGHWAYMHIKHSNTNPPAIISITLDDTKVLNPFQKSYIEGQLQQLSHKHHTSIPKVQGLEAGILTNTWSGGYNAVAALLTQALEDGILMDNPQDPLLIAAKNVEVNKHRLPPHPLEMENALQALAITVSSEMAFKTVSFNVDPNKFSPLSGSLDRLEDEAGIIVLAQLMGSCLTRLKKHPEAVWPLSYEGEGPGRTAKDIRRERLLQEAGMFCLNRLKTSLEKRFPDRQPLKAIQTNPSQPYFLTETNYIVSWPEGKEELNAPVVGDKKVPAKRMVSAVHAPRPLPAKAQAESQYLGTGAYEGAVNVVMALFVKHMSTHGIFTDFPGATRMILEKKPEKKEAKEEKEEKLQRLPSNVLALNAKTPVDLKRHIDAGTTVPAYFDVSQIPIGYIHGMVSAIPKAIELQWPKLVEIAKQKFPHRFNPDEHEVLQLLNHLTEEERIKLIEEDLPKLLEADKVNITEVLLGNCTSKTSSCYGCTSFVSACGMTPSAIHLGGSYSWLPPIPLKPPFENASPEMEWILTELYKKYCREMQVVLKTGVEAMEAFVATGHSFGLSDKDKRGLSKALEELSSRLSQGTPEEAAAFYLDALTVHKKTIERPIHLLPLESILAKIALELAELSKETKDMKLKIQSGAMDLKAYVNSKPVFDVEKAIIMMQVNSESPKMFKTNQSYLNALFEKLSEEKLESNSLMDAITALKPLDLDPNKDGSLYKNAGAALFLMYVAEYLYKTGKFRQPQFELSTIEGRKAIIQASSIKDFVNAVDDALLRDSIYIEEVFLAENLTEKDNENFTLLGPLNKVGDRYRNDYVTDKTFNASLECIFETNNQGRTSKAKDSDAKIMACRRKIENIEKTRNMMDDIIERVALDILQRWYPNYDKEESKDKKEYEYRLKKLNRVSKDNYPESFMDVIKEQIRINEAVGSGKVLVSEIGNHLEFFPIDEHLENHQFDIYQVDPFPYVPLSQLGPQYAYIKPFYKTFEELHLNRAFKDFHKSADIRNPLLKSLSKLFLEARARIRVMPQGKNETQQLYSKWTDLITQLSAIIEAYKENKDDNAYKDELQNWSNSEELGLILHETDARSRAILKSDLYKQESLLDLWAEINLEVLMPSLGGA